MIDLVEFCHVRFCSFAFGVAGMFALGQELVHDDSTGPDVDFLVVVLLCNLLGGHVNKRSSFETLAAHNADDGGKPEIHDFDLGASAAVLR